LLTDPVNPVAVEVLEPNVTAGVPVIVLVVIELLPPAFVATAVML
jgi:hypothetical protein